MERLLVIWCPGLLEEDEDGRLGRAFAGVVAVAASFSPGVQVVRPGICAMPTRGPSRYFGGDAALARQVLEAVAAGPDATGGDATGGSGDRRDARVGVADGLVAAVLAARSAETGPVVVPPGASAAFLADWPVAVLGRPDLADLLERLGVRTLGQFAALGAAHVLARLGSEGAACHAVARGLRGELPGDRVAPRTWHPLRGAGAPRRVRPWTTPDEEGPDQRTPADQRTRADRPARADQPGFWGEAAAAETRAEQAVSRVCELLGPEAVAVGRLHGGRGPAERGRLVAWVGRRMAASSPGHEPWPGQLPPPAPVVVLRRPVPAALQDTNGDGVAVGADGMASAAPARLSVTGGPWMAVVAWAGPWPVDERWWTGGERRRRARMQVVTESQMAYLLVREHGGWWVEGAYD